MYQPVNVVQVHIWGQLVGAVAADPASGAYVFEYDSRWQQRGIELAPIHMPLARRLHVFPQLPALTYKRLPAMLADALPDTFGNALIDAALAREGVAQSAITPLDRLAYVGPRGMGALEFKPARGPRTRKPTAIELADLVTGARAALAGRLSSDHEAAAAIHNLIQVGISAGGARAKAVIAWNPATQEIRSGQLPADEGFEYWLLKLDGVGHDLHLGSGQDYGRIEYAYHLMAVDAGIAMTECRLLEENGRAHFMTRRFDRDGQRKHHLQSLCAMSHLDYNQRATHDYNQLFLTCQALQLDSTAMQEAYRRMVFNVATANNDDHTKNFGFLLREGGPWQLAPAYDITHAHSPTSEWTHQHLMSVNGKFRDIERSDLLLVADRFKIPGAKRIIEQINDVTAGWLAYASKAAISPAEQARVGADIREL
ncbi:type II toxin-antitoxin system HipA family toxin [Viridibacterium curvum]|uniref:Type II toxin-antitoxin system HipA family toxin n=1 Tax=Viridibacterium curvum TaxID=1101404 RepID=A0ABP9QAR8_9RHOO